MPGPAQIWTLQAQPPALGTRALPPSGGRGRWLCFTQKTVDGQLYSHRPPCKSGGRAGGGGSRLPRAAAEHLNAEAPPCRQPGRTCPRRRGRPCSWPLCSPRSVTCTGWEARSGLGRGRSRGVRLLVSSVKEAHIPPAVTQGAVTGPRVQGWTPPHLQKRSLLTNSSNSV